MPAAMLGRAIRDLKTNQSFTSCLTDTVESTTMPKLYGSPKIKQWRKNMLKIVALILLLSPSAVIADQTFWEYQVIFLPGTASGVSVEKHSSGGYLDPTKTRILNALAKEGWEVISVVGASGADHAVYMRKKK